jgi:hypothetical protein
MVTPAPLQEPPNFSLALGGPLYRMLARSHLASSVPTLLRRQAAIVVLLCWVPLAVLSVVQAHFLGGVKLSFLRDIETHVRFLVSLPVLILAEMMVNQRIRPITKRFVERRTVTPEELPQFYAAINTALRIHNSVIVEIVLLVFMFTGGMWIWRHQIAQDVASWYATSQNGQIHLTMAGYWLAYVSVPVFQFIVLRWYMQFMIWFWFLFRVSRLKLQLPPLHPDRGGGIGFVGTSTLAFAPLLFAHSALLSGQLAGRIFYNGGSLIAYEMTILGYVFLSVVATLSPLFWFSSQLMRAKRRGLARYGNFASGFVTEFDQKWLKSKVNGEPSLAGEDVQSLADLNNSFAVVRHMRFVPIAGDDIVLLFVVTLAPFLPLLLTVMAFDQLVIHAIRIVF